MIATCACFFHPPAGRRRRGVSVVMLLGLIASVLALSYFAMRSGVVASQVQGNGNLQAQAREAARAGMAVALRKMHDGSWTGIAQQVSGTLRASQGFLATYATGDPQLAAAGAEAGDWPYRVTVVSTGTAADPLRPSVAATYRIQAVVKLLPRQTAANPAVFTSALSYTVYQYASSDFEVQLPSQVQGPIRLQGKLRLADDYPQTSNSLPRYLGDLNAMRGNGYPDCRPLTATVDLPFNNTSGSTRNLLTDQLGLAVNNISSMAASGWSFPGAIGSYRIYPGGEAYQAADVAASLANTSLAPDPRSNPLGIFVRAGSLTIGNNVAVRGLLVATGDVQITGTNVSLEAAALPALAGADQAVQLPAIVVGGRLNVGSGAAVQVRGLAAVFDRFAVQSGTAATKYDHQGRMIVNGFAIEDRTEFVLAATTWSALWSAFNAQLSPVTPGTIAYYPVWLSKLGLPYAPALTLAPESGSVRYQWKDAGNAVYVRNTADPGLRWTLVRWKEGF